MPLFSWLRRTPKAFAIDFADLSLQLLETQGSAHNGAVHSYARMEVPEGIFERGVIKNQAQAVNAIRRLVQIAQPQAPSSHRVAAELPESLTFLHHFSIPTSTDKRDLADAILEQVAISMPFNIDEYAWDFQILQKTNESYEILFAAAQADIVSAYEQTLSLAGLELVALEPESISLARVLLPQTSLKKAFVAFIDIGGSGTDIILADTAGIRLSVRRSEGGRQMTQAIAQKLKLTTAVAETRKCVKGLLDKALAPVLIGVLEPLAAELKQAVEYQERISNLPFGGILLAGGGSRLPGLSDFLGQTFNVPVQLGLPTISIPNVSPQDLITISGVAERARSLLTGINFIVPPG